MESQSLINLQSSGYFSVTDFGDGSWNRKSNIPREKEGKGKILFSVSVIFSNTCLTQTGNKFLSEKSVASSS